MRLQSSSLSAGFNSGSDSDVEIKNILTGTVFAGGVRQKLIARPLEGVSEPVLFPNLISSEVTELSASFHYLDESGENAAEVEWIPDGDEIVIRVKVELQVPVWMLEWTLEGVHAERIIVPALGGQCISAAMPAGNRLDYKYPFWWNAQFALLDNMDNGLMLFSRDTEPVHKLLRIQKNKQSFAITAGYEAEAPVKDTSLSTRFLLKGYSGGWEAAVDEFKHWMHNAYSVTRLKDNPGYPEWARNKNLILEMWGAHREMEVPGHTFEQMKERLTQWKDIHPPEETLVYLPGFAEHGIDSHAPDYNPSPQCGGPEKFRELTDYAHHLGYHVMVHTNVLAMTYTHRLWAEFRKYQVVDVFGRPQGWAMDLDGDWLTEPFFAYMNPGNKSWRRYMRTVMDTLVNQYKVDGIFLDQTLLSFNDINGPNFLQGMVDHILYLRNSFPEVLFAGEGLHEFNVRSLPMAQIHGIDSIAGVHGQEEELPWRTVHPVSAYLFKEFTRLTGHLLTKNPADPMFEKQEGSYAEIGAIPVIALYNSDQSWDHPILENVLKRAKTFKQNQ